MLPVSRLLARNGIAAPAGSVFRDRRVYEYSRAREALADCVRALQMRPGESILLPAYICPAVIEPFEKLGIKLLFYPIDESLAPEAEAVRELLVQKPRAILIVHYFGFAPEVQAVVQACRNQEVPIIEDCAHTLPSYEIASRASFGDVTIFSLPKLLPVPDGALAVINNEDLKWLELPTKSNKRLTCVNSLWQIANTTEVVVGLSLRTKLRESRRTVSMITDLRESPVPNGAFHSYNRFQMSGVARWIARKIDIAAVVQRRKQNYNWLLEATKSIKGVRPRFGDLKPSGAPLGFPIMVDDRECVRSKLLAAGVDPRPIWSALPPQVPAEGFATARDIAAHNLVLPVHQDLTPKGLAHITSVLNRAVGG